jgi:hypothetical protein
MTKAPLRIAAALGIALTACSSSNQTSPDAPPAGPPRAVVVTTGNVGVISTLDPASYATAAQITATAGGAPNPIGADPVLRHFGRELFVVNRSEGNVAILDDQTLTSKALLSTGAGSSPQDVAVLGNKLYVATLGSKGVTVLTRGSAATAEIDLSVDDPDGKPDCQSVYLVGSSLYVSCRLLAGGQPTVPGKVYVIDTATDKLKPGLTMVLSHKNPLSLFEQIPSAGPHGGDLLISTAEDLVAPGCIERIATGAAPTAAGCVIDGAMLGGYVTRADVQVQDGAAMVWSAVTTTYPAANLRAYDLVSSTLWDILINAPDTQIADVTHCPDGQVVAVDRTMSASGLRVYVNAVEKTTNALSIGGTAFSPHGLVCY